MFKESSSVNVSPIIMHHAEQTTKKLDYGYEEAIPDIAAKMSRSFQEIPGCENKPQLRRHNSIHLCTTTPRRSSFKSNSPKSVHRRNSIGCTTSSTIELNIGGKIVHRRRSIVFEDTPEISCIPPSDSNRELWYRKCELVQMKHERDEVVRRMRLHQLEADDDTLGLEKFAEEKTPKEDIGHGEDTLNIDCGYEEAIPDNAIKQGCDNISFSKRNNSLDLCSAAPRRSSLRSNSPHSMSRRNSIGCTTTTTIEVSIRGKPVHRRRSINFEDQPQITSVLPASSLTEDGSTGELWYRTRELSQMKQDRNEVVKRMRTHQLQADDDILGLEKFANIHFYREYRWRARTSVLEEQKAQEVKGIFDEEKISNVYHQSTQRTAEIAFRLAAGFKNEVDEYLNTPCTPSLKNSNLRRSCTF